MKGDSVKSKKGVDLRAQAEQFAAQRAAVLSDPAKPARDRAESIRDGLRSWVATRLLITEAYKGEDWIALGYTSWELYCDSEFDMKSLRLTADERNDAILSFRSVGMTTREIGAATGTSKNTAQRALAKSRVPDGTKSPLVEAVRGEIEAAAERTETSGAVAPASTDSASPVVGEPGDSEQAAESSGTQTAADGPHPPTADAVEVPGDRAEEAVAPDGGLVLPSGVTPEELAEEEAAEPPADLPAAATTSLPDGDGDPTPEPEQQPGHNSPTGLEAAQPREDRSETDHQQDAGVSSPAGEAPEVASTDPVEPVELEDGGTAQDPPSSSEPVVIRASVEDMIGTVERLEVPREEWDSWTPAQRRAHIDNFGAEVMNNCGGYGVGIESGAPVSDLDDEEPIEPPPGDRLMLAFATLIHYVGEVDTDAVGPLLAGDDLHTLDEHVEELAAFVRRIRKARFVEARTP